jgi:solute carrier family 32 (vesicular inhibitory amino acid transporter)
MRNNTTHTEGTPLLASAAVVDLESATPTPASSPALSDGNNSSSGFNSDGADGGTAAQASEQQQQILFQELEEAWPSTFQRSISILASPVIRKDDAVLYTRSPMPGSTPQMLARRTTLKRGFYTPERPAAAAHLLASTLSSRQSGSGGGDDLDDHHDEEENGDHDGFSPLSKIKSMDWVKKKVEKSLGGIISQSPGNPMFQPALQVQAQKAQAAAEYRKQILQQQQQQQNQNQKQQKKSASAAASAANGAKSPGFFREKAMLQAGKKAKAEQQQKQQKQQQQQKRSQKAGTDDHKSSFSQATFNLANILMGVGLLGLPFAYMSAGWIGGNVCVLVFAFMCWRTAILIGRELNGDPRPTSQFVAHQNNNSNDSKSSLLQQPSGSATAEEEDPNKNIPVRMLKPIATFPDIARNAFGQVGCAILSIILYFELFSCICIFFVSMGDHLNQLVPSIPIQIHMILVACLSIIPTILLRTPALLSYLSAVGTIATVVVVATVVLTAVTQGDMTEHLAEIKGVDPEAAKPYHIMFDATGITLALGLVAYCFSGHAIVPSIYTSMKNPQDFEYMVTTTFLTVMVVCLAVSTSGYYMFGSMVSDQVTLSLERAASHSHVGRMVMKALLWLMVMTAFSKTTLTMFPLAIGMEELVAPYLTSDHAVAMSSTVIKLILTFSALAVAILIPSFSFLCAVVGMICTMTVSVIFPAAAHLQLFGPRLSLWEKFLDWVFVLVGIFMAVIGTYAAL